MFVWKFMWWSVKAVITLTALVFGAVFLVGLFLAWVFAP